MSEARDRRRHELLARTISPLVHRLNNLLAIAGGQCDVWAALPIAADTRFRAELERVRASTVEMGAMLAALSDMSKPDEDLSEDGAELAHTFASIRALALPLANESNVALQLECVGGSAVLTIERRRLERSLQLATIAAIVQAAPTRGRVHLRAFIGPGRVSFSLTAQAAIPARARAEIAADLASIGRAGVRSRSASNVTAWRAVVPAKTTLAAPGSEAPTQRIRKKVLLVQPDALIADLIGSVLLEEGYAVEITESVEAALRIAEGCDVMLLDAGAIARAREGARRLVEAVPRAVVLGSGGGEELGLPELPKPCGPDALVRAIGRL